MKISELCIRRPVFATVLSLGIMLIGLVSYTRLPVREYPKIDEPVVTVDTTYRGASAEIVESQISKPRGLTGRHRGGRCHHLDLAPGEQPDLGALQTRT